MVASQTVMACAYCSEYFCSECDCDIVQKCSIIFTTTMSYILILFISAYINKKLHKEI